MFSYTYHFVAWVFLRSAQHFSPISLYTGCDVFMPTSFLYLLPSNFILPTSTFHVLPSNFILPTSTFHLLPPNFYLSSTFPSIWWPIGVIHCRLRLLTSYFHFRLPLQTSTLDDQVLRMCTPIILSCACVHRYYCLGVRGCNDYYSFTLHVLFAHALKPCRHVRIADNCLQFLQQTRSPCPATNRLRNYNGQ